jgi:hypothetical protein
MEIVECDNTTLRAIGKDESWLEQWILEKPTRLGLGEIRIHKNQVTHYRNQGGRLDILGYRADLDTYYEVEIMLGECDADHGFRTLDYWARERLLKPNSRHVAVLIAENLSGRYKTIVETLPQFLPFIGIEIQVLKLPVEGGVATIQMNIVAQPDDLIITTGDEPAPDVGTGDILRDRTWWETNSNPTFMSTVDKISAFCSELAGPSRVDYSAQSYVSLKKGRRCWLPMWPRVDGAYVYIPGGSGGGPDAPSDFFNQVRAKLEEAQLGSPGWTYKYNGGANPIGFAVPFERATHSMIKEILVEAYHLA